YTLVDEVAAMMEALMTISSYLVTLYKNREKARIALGYHSMRAGTRSRLDLAGEQQRDRGDRQHHADDGEGVAEADDERLALHRIADRHDRLMLCGCHVGDAVGEEIIRQGVDALPHFVAIERHRLADDVRVELFALGQHGGKRRRADRAAEIAHHVGETGGC